MTEPTDPAPDLVAVRAAAMRTPAPAAAGLRRAARVLLLGALLVTVAALALAVWGIARHGHPRDVGSPLFFATLLVVVALVLTVAALIVVLKIQPIQRAFADAEVQRAAETRRPGMV